MPVLDNSSTSALQLVSCPTILLPAAVGALNMTHGGMALERRCFAEHSALPSWQDGRMASRLM